MGSIIALICSFVFKWVKWMIVDFPLIIIRLWIKIIKVVWTKLPFVAIALGIAVAEMIVLLLFYIIFSKTGNSDGVALILKIYDGLTKYQFDANIPSFIVKTCDQCIQFITNPSLNNIFSKVIAIIISVVIYSCMIGVLIFLLITFCIILSWKFLLAALIINLIINLIKYIAVTRQSKLPVE